MAFVNAYDDTGCADAYARLEFPGTYYLAYRDLPELIAGHVRGTRALDFGCGAGRSTRFLRRLGFQVTGIDISANMIGNARRIDPDGDYRLIADGDFSTLSGNSMDLILSAFTFDNIPGRERKVGLFAGLAGLLNPEGILLNLVSRPEIYVHEWASFSTRDYPENREAVSGDEVRIINTDIAYAEPVVDILWSHEDYLKVYTEAGLQVVEKIEPLAADDEPYHWVNENNIAPWAIYALKC